MSKESTERFFRLMNEANERIAAESKEEKTATVGEDPVRQQKDAERREKWGQLRARPHSGKRPKGAHNVFGYVDLKER